MRGCLNDGKFGCIYSLGDFEKACSKIHETDWDTILTSDVDDAAKQWCDSFLAIME